MDKMINSPFMFYLLGWCLVLTSNSPGDILFLIVRYKNVWTVTETALISVKEENMDFNKV